MDKSKIVPYEFAYLSIAKDIWTHSKNSEDGQKSLNKNGQNIFELAL